jgi:undecaprenyl-diphosphatase
LTVPQSLYLGIIQGLTEFLPVSSTAHLVLAPTLFGFADPPHAFDVALHLGTLIALLIYFREEWLRLLRGGVRLLAERRIDEDIDQRMALMVVLGCIPAGIAGFLLEKKVDALSQPQEHPSAYLIMAIALIGFGLLMGWVDHISRKSRSVKNLSPGEATLIGVVQALALIPGVSRSGSTITGGLFVGLTREAAARFSFLLSGPIIAVAAAWDGLKLIRHTVPGEEAISAAAFLAGIIASAIVGWFCIHFLLEYLRRRSLWIFVYYRVVLGIFLIALFMHNR